MNFRLINIQTVRYSRQNDWVSGNHGATDEGIPLRYIIIILDIGSHMLVFNGRHNSCWDFMQITDR